MDLVVINKYITSPLNIRKNKNLSPYLPSRKTQKDKMEFEDYSDS